MEQTCDRQACRLCAKTRKKNIHKHTPNIHTTSNRGRRLKRHARTQSHTNDLSLCQWRNTQIYTLWLWIQLTVFFFLPLFVCVVFFKFFPQIYQAIHQRNTFVQVLLTVLMIWIFSDSSSFDCFLYRLWFINWQPNTNTHAISPNTHSHRERETENLHTFHSTTQWRQWLTLQKSQRGKKCNFFSNSIP